jgi:hypothetical protein
MDIKMAMAENAGGIMGTAILKKIANSFNPSTRPASIKSRGIPSTYCLKKKIAKGETTIGRNTPQKVLIKEMVIINLYSGSMRIWIGTNIKKITIVVTIFLPLNLYRESPYATNELKKRARMVCTTISMRLFLNHMK